jgi:predicted nucleotidyltransferase
MYYYNYEYIEEWLNTNSKKTYSIISLLKDISKIEALAVFGSYAEKSKKLRNDLDLILVVKELEINETHGFHVNNKDMCIDFVLLQSNRKSISEKYLKHSILKNSTTLFSETKSAYDLLKKYQNPQTPVNLNLEEDENYIFHLKWIIDKIERKKHEDPVLTSILTAKFIYFITLLAPRWENYPVNGESYGLNVIKKNHPKLYKKITENFSILSNVNVEFLKEILTEVSNNKNIFNNGTLIEVKNLIVPVQYSKMKRGEYISVKKFANTIESILSRVE